MSPREAAVADAGPIIHLDELSRLALLECYDRVWVPERVAREAERHRANWRERSPQIIEVVNVPLANVQTMRRRLSVALHPGEVEMLALWEEHQEASVLCDDLNARRVARDSGASVIGTLGLIIKAAKQQRLDVAAAMGLITSIPERTTLHLSRDLLQWASSELETRLRKVRR